MRYRQDLQVSLRDRLRRIMVADCGDAGHEVWLVTDWIAQQPTLRAILAEAEQAEPGLAHDSLVTSLQERLGGLGRQFRWPGQTETARADLIWNLMQRISSDYRAGTDSAQLVINYAHGVSGSTNMNDMWQEFTERIIRPLFDYLDERVGAESSVLYTLERYVAASNGSTATFCTTVRWRTPRRPRMSTTLTCGVSCSAKASTCPSPRPNRRPASLTCSLSSTQTTRSSAR